MGDERVLRQQPKGDQWHAQCDQETAPCVPPPGRLPLTAFLAVFVATAHSNAPRRSTSLETMCKPFSAPLNLPCQSTTAWWRWYARGKGTFPNLKKLAHRCFRSTRALPQWASPRAASSNRPFPFAKMRAWLLLTSPTTAYSGLTLKEPGSQASSLWRDPWSWCKGGLGVVGRQLVYLEDKCAGAHRACRGRSLGSAGDDGPTSRSRSASIDG